MVDICTKPELSKCSEAGAFGAVPEPSVEDPQPGSNPLADSAIEWGQTSTR